MSRLLLNLKIVCVNSDVNAIGMNGLFDGLIHGHSKCYYGYTLLCQGNCPGDDYDGRWYTAAFTVYSEAGKVMRTSSGWTLMDAE